jgi:hypothetical protein
MLAGVGKPMIKTGEGTIYNQTSPLPNYGYVYSRI